MASIPSWFATTDPDTIVPSVVRLATKPGTVLIWIAAFFTGILTVCTIIAGVSHAQGAMIFGCLMIALCGFFITLLWIRRHQLLKAADSLGGVEVINVPKTDVATIDSSSTVNSGESSFLDMAKSRANDVRVEISRRPSAFMPQVVVAQRAALAALGGPVKAPYLVPDLRVTVVAVMGTLFTIPVAILSSAIVLITALLSHV
ncbi:hypothetical protein [Actinomyces vulturis]|uniref:hypothetical protein n=1 Tax=Actinomyces vulturis TaxID=1857645 RepID=UPI00083240EF|nr:hypothetical protein [Actinomyces vulturis]